MSDGGITAQPLGSPTGVNWIFSIELVVCGVLSIWFLFYFNRLFATLVSFAIRAYTWHAYRAYVDITSLQISLLGGRIFFKSLQYRAHNETILIHDGRITWRYWMRKVQDADVYRTVQEPSLSPTSTSDVNSSGSPSIPTEKHDKEAGQVKAQPILPCRLHIRVSGVEAFFYNHSPSYDHILSEVEAAKRRNSGSRPGGARGASQPPSSTTSSGLGEKSSHDNRNADSNTSPLEYTATASTNNAATSTASTSLPAYLGLFPIQVECKKAAAAIGNENTTSVIVAKAEAAKGRIDAGQAGPLDLFKLLFLFDINNVRFDMRPNQGFKQTQLKAAAEAKQYRTASTHRRGPFYMLQHRVSQLVRSIRRGLHTRRGAASVRTASTTDDNDGTMPDATGPTPQAWHGLSRFLQDHDQSQNDEWDRVDYARLSSLADFESMAFKFQWDVAGTVPQGTLANLDSVNGDRPPDYGLEVTVRNGIINYGPWTDRERVILQAVFFPGSMVNTVPFPALRPGDFRISTVLDMNFFVEGNVKLRIPIREPSKDWKWQSLSPHAQAQKVKAGVRRRGFSNTTSRKLAEKRAKEVNSQDKRPFGWLDITVEQDTNVHYKMDMYARGDGFHNSLRAEVRAPKISSSVNHDVLWRSGDIKVTGDLSNPLEWNTIRTWTFHIHCAALELFMLRDHMFLLTDLVSDWTSGPPAAFHTFVPFRYKLHARFENFRLFLNSNDANLINRPTDLDDNSFLILAGDQLEVDFAIPLEYFNPPRNTFHFSVLAHDLVLDIHHPPKSTLNQLLRDKRVGQVPRLTLSGSYTSNAEQALSLTDVLQMEIRAIDPTLVVFGYLLRSFVNFKDNYFGEFLHFRTFEEYQASNGDTAAAIREEIEKHRYRRSNDLDVILSIIVEQPTLKLPSSLYSAEQYILADVPVANIDLRVTNYYLDMQVDIDPVSITHVERADSEGMEIPGEQLRIESVNVAGHRLFGLPPDEPAYVSTFDVYAGDVSGKCTPQFLNQLVSAGQAFAFAFDDGENKFPFAPGVVVNDVIFLQLGTGTVDVGFEVGNVLLSLALEPIDLRFDDAADDRSSARLTTRLPNLTISCSQSVASAKSTKDHGHGDRKCILFLQTTVDINLFLRNQDAQAKREKQQLHLQMHDSRTHRAMFLYQFELHETAFESYSLPIDPPAIYLPDLPVRLSHNRQASRAVRSMSSTHARKEVPTHINTTHSRGAVIDTESITSPYLHSDHTRELEAAALQAVPEYLVFDQDDQSVQADDEVGSADDLLEDDEEQQTLLINFVPGIRILVLPEIARTIADVAKVLVPDHEDDLMDRLQLTVLGQVETLMEARTSNSSFDLRAKVASVILRVDTAIESNTHRMDMVATGTKAAFRLRKALSSGSDIMTKVIHVESKSLGLDFFAHHNSNLSQQRPHFQLDVADILAWGTLAEINTFNLALKVCTVFLDTERISRLAQAGMDIADQALTIARFIADFDNALPGRITKLLKFVSSRHAGVADPPLHLSRMTYVLRAFPNHIRNQGSWKMLTRIRHVLTSFGAAQRLALAAEVRSGNNERLQGNSSVEEVLGWCSWDVTGAQDTSMYQYMASNSATGKDPAAEQPVQCSLKLGLARLLLGTGDRCSEVALADLALDLTLEPPAEPTGLSLAYENIRTLINVACTSSMIFVRLKWDIVWSIDSILDVVHQRHDFIRGLSTSDGISRTSTVDSFIARNDMHAVFASEDVTFILDTINLQHTSSIRELQMSLIQTSKQSHNYADAMAFLIGCKHATSELTANQAPQQRIWKSMVDDPGLYLDVRHRLHPAGTEINLGGTYGYVTATLEQEPVGLLATIDRVLGGEVAHALRLQASIEQLMGPSPGKQADRVTEHDQKKLEINAGLLAGPFDLNVAVLQTLAINIRGELANLRIRPRNKHDSPVIIESDLGPIRFAAISAESKLAGDTALFLTPSIGTSAEIHLTDLERSLNLSSSIEQMHIEALAIQNIISVIKRPEVQSALQALEDGVSDLQRRIGAMFKSGPSKPTVSSATVTPQLRYSINVASAGLEIAAHAPLRGNGTNSADLVLGLGSVQIAVDNGQETGRPLHKVPQVFAKVESIFANLDMTDAGKKQPCGHVQVAVLFRLTQPTSEDGSTIGDIHITSDSLDVEVNADTASTMVDIVTDVQRRIYELDLTKEIKYLADIRRRTTRIATKSEGSQVDHSAIDTIAELAPTNVVVSLNHIRLAWIVGSANQLHHSSEEQDLELTLAQVEFLLQHRNQAQLKIRSLQLQMVPASLGSGNRSLNSALLPEMLFLVRFSRRGDGICLTLQAIGQTADFQFDSECVSPMHMLIKSGKGAMDKYRTASKKWFEEAKPDVAETTTRPNPFGARKLVSVIVDVNFAGGLLHLQGKPSRSIASQDFSPLSNVHAQGRTVQTTLKSPGVAMKLQYQGAQDLSSEATLTSEIKISASNNTVYPELVPIILRITDHVQQAMQESETSDLELVKTESGPNKQKSTMITLPNEDLLRSNELLARTKISVGLRIIRQEFGLSCQPIAKVNAKAHVEDIYISFDTIDSTANGRFLSIAAVLTGFKASVQHVYSRESTFSFDIDSISLSVMNSKHVRDKTAGLTAVLKFDSMRMFVNARQLQDLLLFGEIWFPSQLRKKSTDLPNDAPVSADEYLVQRYRQVSDVAAFPWTATITLAQVALDIDFGQSIGKTSLEIRNLWISSTKTSGWKQELVIGIDNVGGKSVGRMGGLIHLSDLRVRTFIEWPIDDGDLSTTPLVQATVGFDRLKVKASFDYQPFAFADFGGLSFVMFNVREGTGRTNDDRLVVKLDLDNAYAYATATSADQGLALYQAFDRLIQEKQAALHQSIQDIHKDIRRPSVAATFASNGLKPPVPPLNKVKGTSPIKLRSDVMVRVRRINAGVYPSTFFDGQLLKLEAIDGQARFLVDITKAGKIHSNLSLVLGQLQVALASSKKINVPKSLGDIAIEAVIESGLAAQGGTIVRVPRLVASMETWQPPQAKVIEYIFRSTFEGKIDVGWNMARIGSIRNLWHTHTKSLATRMGKALPESAVRITTALNDSAEAGQGVKSTTGGSFEARVAGAQGEGRGKITAVINMPLSRYEYVALEPAVIETPQLRDMGEATPPLEWIGLQRDRLPNVVHQVVIVALLELAQEVEDAYGRILGSS